MQHIKHTQSSLPHMGLVNIHLNRQKEKKTYPFFPFLVFRINDGFSFSYSSWLHIAVNHKNTGKCDYLRGANWLCASSLSISSSLTLTLTYQHAGNSHNWSHPFRTMHYISKGWLLKHHKCS